jgi:glycosyltransferase involved in cell wall biosynthesis
MHDMPHGGVSDIPVHAIFAISQFQAEAWKVRGRGVFVTADGVDLDVFRSSPLEERDQNALVWVSNPDRGLPLAARIFQNLRKRWPELTLHVYGRSSVYGWDAQTEMPFLPQPEQMENVVLHDPLPRAGLAEVLRHSWAMFYPTWWPETFCMAAMEAQACGTPVICPPAGALPESVQGGIIGYDFLNAVSQLRNPARWRKLSELGVEWAQNFGWENIAAGWCEIFEEVKRECGLSSSATTDNGAN